MRLNQGAFWRNWNFIEQRRCKFIRTFSRKARSSIDFVMDVNLKGTIFCTNFFAKHVIDRSGGGVVVNVASHYGIISPDPSIYGNDDRRSPEVYGATKAGIIQLSRYYAVHLASNNIRVNSVSPGGVKKSLLHHRKLNIFRKIIRFVVLQRGWQKLQKLLSQSCFYFQMTLHTSTGIIL